MDLIRLTEMLSEFQKNSVLISLKSLKHTLLDVDEVDTIRAFSDSYRDVGLTLYKIELYAHTGNKIANLWVFFTEKMGNDNVYIHQCYFLNENSDSPLQVNYYDRAEMYSDKKCKLVWRFDELFASL